jgi:hypothetical protein
MQVFFFLGLASCSAVKLFDSVVDEQAVSAKQVKSVISESAFFDVFIYPFPLVIIFLSTFFIVHKYG